MDYNFYYFPHRERYSNKLSKLPILEPCNDSSLYIGQFNGIDVYGVENGKYYSNSELHLVLDIDHTIYPGQCCNDLEVLAHIMISLKQNYQFNKNKIIPQDIDPKMQELMSIFFKNLDIDNDLDDLVPYCIRPGLPEFVDNHRHAKWWTFTNKYNSNFPLSNGLGYLNLQKIRTVDGTDHYESSVYNIDRMIAAFNRYVNIENEMPIIVGDYRYPKDVATKITAGIVQQVFAGIRKAPERITVLLLDDTKTTRGFCHAVNPRNLLHVEKYLEIPRERVRNFISKLELIFPTNAINIIYNYLNKRGYGRQGFCALINSITDSESLLLHAELNDSIQVHLN